MLLLRLVATIGRYLVIMAGTEKRLRRALEEKDLRNILQESALYVELSPDEQDVLLQHIAEFYYSCSSGSLVDYYNNMVA